MTSPLTELAVGLPRTYLRPFLLLLIGEGTSHGYELLDRVAALGLDRVDAGGLYRCLRAMDEEGLVRSTWEPSASGPARRNYELTPAGRDALLEYGRAMDEVARNLREFGLRHRELSHPAP